MKNHSIAPWKAAYSYSPAYVRDIKDAQGEIIAQVCDLEKGTDESGTNARIITAAPELLQLMEDLLVLHIAHHNHPTHAAARQLIQRIKGTQ
jgi:hypothetical protein